MDQELETLRQHLMIEKLGTIQALEDTLLFTNMGTQDKTKASGWLATLTHDELCGLSRLADVLDYTSDTIKTLVAVQMIRRQSVAKQN